MRSLRKPAIAVTASVAALGLLVGVGTVSAAPSASSPVQVTLVGEFTGVVMYPNLIAGAQAAADAVNASGGIDGRHFQVNTCNTQGVTTPAPSEACAHNVVSNKADLAVIGTGIDAFATQINTILNAAHVANVGDQPLSAAELSDPNSFPLVGSEGAAEGDVLADAGYKKIVLAYYGGEEAAAAIDLENAALKSRGLKLTGSIPVPPTATDYTPYVASAASKGNAVAMAVTATQFAAWLTAAKSGNYTQKLCLTNQAATAKLLKTLGSKANGVLVAAGLPPVTDTSLTGIRLFRTQIRKYEPSAQITEVTLDGWLSAWAFAQVARTIKGTLDRASVLSAWSHLTNFNVFDLLPPHFTTSKPASVPGMSRLFNSDIVEGVVKNGSVVATSGWVPVFTRP